MTKTLRIALSALALAAGAQAQAGLLTSAAALSPSATVITFSDQAGQFTTGPVQVGNLVGKNVVYTADSASAGFSMGYGLAGNGNWTGGKGFAFTNGAAAVTFTFNNGPVAGVGGFVNYADCGGGSTCGAGNFVIEALGSSGNVLESYIVNLVAPISTPGGTDLGAFRGISRNSADVYGFRFSGGYGVLDDLRFGAVAGQVPEPGALGLVALALLGAAAARRRVR